MFFAGLPGIIALDIDGTITDQAHTLHADVIGYFKELHAKGWQFVFITGRPFQWGHTVLQHLPFTYTFAVQNGALILQMPSQVVINRKYLNDELLPHAESICQQMGTDFVIYAGWEYQDTCYFRSQFFEPDLLNYLNTRFTTLKEKWIKVATFNSLPLNEYLSIKCFANSYEKALALSQQFEKKLGLHAPVNRDPFNPNYFIVQATHSEANKGEALRTFMRLSPTKGPILAAGDDYNDESMLKQADIRIVMSNAPEPLKELADVIAPTAAVNGIIEGLQKAIDFVHKENVDV
jgi:Cof subfamily protein (haloacid dehalogenase superfamily)